MTSAPGEATAELLHSLESALDGGPPVFLGAPQARPENLTDYPHVALALATSGSTTGTGRVVGLSAAALRASTAATYERLAGPGQWLLTLPPDHVAGVQVLVRSLLAGTTPVATEGSFDTGRLARAVEWMRTDVPRYVSLVPTQLVRVLQDPRAVAALATCAAVLVGGAAAPAGALARARAAGIPVVTTYGMTETCGGCVYDGVPLAGVQVELARAGRVLLRGPMLAEGYLDSGGQPFVEHGGVRWLRTADVGRYEHGVLSITGRVDDVILTGGVNVHPGEVEAELSALPGIAQVCVVGTADPEWGQLVTAVVVPDGGACPGLESLRQAVGSGPHAPRALVTAAELPLRDSGKVDRRASAALAEEELRTGRGVRH